jgi:hypothetical protein
MLNTAWDDDGETFNAPNWYGFAWGAECAWSGSSTTSADFNRRVGAALFGEEGNAFGTAIQALSTSAVDGLPNRQFWHFAFGPIKVRTPELARAQWQSSLEPIRAAIAGFERCQKTATRNAELLDYFLFGARRMELCFARELDRLDAALIYRQARRLPLETSLPLLEQAQGILACSRDAHQAISARFAELWARENKPYALDWTVKRYRELIQKYEGAIERLSRARAAAKPDRSLPTPREIGLELVEENRP